MYRGQGTLATELPTSAPLYSQPRYLRPGVCPTFGRVFALLNSKQFDACNQSRFSASRLRLSCDIAKSLRALLADALVCGYRKVPATLGTSWHMAKVM